MIGQFVLGLFLLGLVQAQTWDLTLDLNETEVSIGQVKRVHFSLSFPDKNRRQLRVIARDFDQEVLTVEVPELKDIEGTRWNDTISITGVFLGKTEVFLDFIAEDKVVLSKSLPTVVIRPKRLIDAVFTGSVITLVSILYINFGCAMEWSVTRESMKRPIGPLIGSLCRFIIMPLLAFGIGHFLFPDRPDMQIAIFFTGISPSGGASNIWTVLLGGNLNLSIAMTTVSTLASFATIPIWAFTLGKYIFNKGDLEVPYKNIGYIAVCLVIPLALGYFIQRKFPKLCRIMVRILKPCSVILILFIVIFAIITNWYLFKLFSLKIVLAGAGLPWLGFICGLVIMLICRQPQANVRAIAIESGIENTGISIFLLRFSMDQPAADLTTVIPVSVAIMTPIPLLILWFIKTISDKRKRKMNASLEKLQTDTLPVSTSNSSSIRQ